MPWYVIAVIHNMECGLDFTEHLHNGDPLARRTINDPPKRFGSDRVAHIKLPRTIVVIKTSLLKFYMIVPWKLKIF